jgi:hypothetical protein
MFRSLLALAALTLTLTACPKDDGDERGSIVDPPGQTNIERLYTAICLRGNLTIGQLASGSINSQDCDSADFIEDDEGYFESWRLRVTRPERLIVEAESTFDNTITVFSVTEGIEEPEIVFEGWNDDRPSGGTNALLSLELRPGRDYIIIVGGYDYDEQGGYRVRARAYN